MDENIKIGDDVHSFFGRTRGVVIQVLPPTPDVEWERLVIVTDDGLVRIMPAGDFAKDD